MPQSFPAELRIENDVATIAGADDSLESINTHKLAHRSIVAVAENNSLYMLRKESTASPSGSDIVEPVAGPGRWFKYPTASGGGSVVDFSWWVTDAWTQFVGGNVPATPALMSTFDDPPTRDSTSVPTGLTFDDATGIVTNASGGPIFLRCRATLAGINGSYPIPTYLFCVNGTVPDISGQAAFAENGATQISLATDSELFAIVCERVVLLQADDTVELALGYGSPSESAVPVLRSCTISYTVVGAAP